MSDVGETEVMAGEQTSNAMLDPMDEQKVGLVEGDADWRPWSGGHESPLEALWQWMVSKGVGGLSDPETAAAQQRALEQKQDQERAEAASIREKEAADAEAAAAHEHDEPTGFAAVDAAATADGGDVKIGGGAIHF